MRSLHFVCNRRSGSGRVAALIDHLATVGPVTDIRDLPALTATSAADPNTGLIACGGDGTVAACIAAMGGRAPVGVVPLGTGNDAARAWGWPAYVRDLATHIVACQTAPLAHADRWLLCGPKLRREFCLYASFGWDAAVALRFHHLRLGHPRWFRGPLVNKAIYALAGCIEPLRPADLICNGHRLAAGSGSLLLASCPSYAGGMRLAGVQEGDGQLDGLELPAGPGLPLRLSGLLRGPTPQRGAAWQLTLTRTLAAQTDGEPWLAKPGDYTVEWLGAAPILRGPGGRGYADSAAMPAADQSDRRTTAHQPGRSA